MKSPFIHVAFLVFTLTPFTMWSQLGIRAQYQIVRFNPWERIETGSALDTKFNGGGYQLGIDYAFRLKNYRIEFYPELSYSRQLALEIENQNYNLSSFGLEVNTHFYFLDFEEDCDCPTWSKSNDWFQKGFFVSIHPGAQVFQYPVQAETESRTQWLASAGIGAGIDIGISEYVTLTPLIKWRHFFTPEWNGLIELYESNSAGISQEWEKRYFNQIQAGLRLGFYFGR
jgi:hypothetical protein